MMQGTHRGESAIYIPRLAASILWNHTMYEENPVWEIYDKIKMRRAKQMSTKIDKIY